MDEAPTPVEEPANLKFLRVLVTVLTATMIAGLVTIIALLVIRLQAPPPPHLPEAIVLPEGETARSFTQGPDWYAVVTESDQILIFDRTTGALRQTVTIEGQN